MANIKNTFSSLKKNAGNKLANLKNRSQKFKEKFEEAKSQPRSKRKSLLLGFTTVLGIFGVTLLTPVLSAVAKDIPKNTPKPGEVCPSPPANQPAIAPSKEIVKGLSGLAASVCALAISSGSFVVGAACGVVVAAKKLYHAPELGIDVESYGISKEDLKLLRTKGLTRYVRMGKPLPSKELIQAYQCSIKVFCKSAQGQKSIYNSPAQSTSHLSYSYTRKGSNIIITFNRETQDLITGGSYNAKDYQNFQDSKVLGGFFKK